MTPGQYIRSYYDVPAFRGARITFEGQPGTITGFRDAYILVRFDEDPDYLAALHPKWHVTYGRRPLHDQRCDVCGRFISNRRWQEFNCFAGDEYAYCADEPVPGLFEDRKQWLRENVGRAA